MNRIKYISTAAVSAALYVVLTIVAGAIGIASGVIQVRFSEALTILPVYTPAAVPGLTIGCLIANIVTGCALPDVIFGTIATLVGAVGTHLLRKHPFIAPIPPILANTIIVPWVLRFAYGAPDAIPYMMGTVGVGEVLSCYVLGVMLMLALKPVAGVIFGDGVTKDRSQTPLA